MHVGAVQPGERALIIDDLVATGGTLCAAIRLLGKFMILFQKLCSSFCSYHLPLYQHVYDHAKFHTMGCLLSERVGAEVAECACVIGLPEVKVIA